MKTLSRVEAVSERVARLKSRVDKLSAAKQSSAFARLWVQLEQALAPDATPSTSMHMVLREDEIVALSRRLVAGIELDDDNRVLAALDVDDLHEYYPGITPQNFVISFARILQAY